MAAPTVWVEAPARVPRTNTLLDLIDVRPFPGGREQPVEYMADNCEFPALTPQDCYITIGAPVGTEKAEGGFGEVIDGPMFGVYAGVDCFINGGVDEMRTMARARLEAGQSSVVEEVLADAMAAADTAVGTGDIIAGIAALETALAQNVNAQGVIWLSPSAATYAASERLLVRDPLTGNLSTYLGTPVVVSTALAGGAVAYASGPVHVWGGSIVETDGYALTVNTVKVLAERMFAAAIECGVWSFTVTAATGENPPPPDDEMVITLGSIPSSPIPDGTSTTIIAQTTEDPDGDITLHYVINGGVEQTAVMTQTETHQFVYAVVGDQTGPGDSVELWATGEYDGVEAESNHITIEVIA